MKAQGNLQEGRHALGRDIFHGRRGELRQRYYEGMEDQLGALSLMLNALVLFNTRYLGATITQLRASGYEVRDADADAARLSPFRHRHINLLGRYSFLLPTGLAGGLRPLRDPDSVEQESDEDEPEKGQAPRRTGLYWRPAGVTAARTRSTSTWANPSSSAMTSQAAASSGRRMRW